MEPVDYFYSWLYIQAVHQQSALEWELLAHNAFTDIEFNSNSSLNCQVQAAACMLGGGSRSAARSVGIKGFVPSGSVWRGGKEWAAFLGILRV